MSTGRAVSSTGTHHVGIIWVGVVFALSSDLQLNRLADRQLASALADLCQVGTTEAMRHFRQVVNVHVLFIIFTMWFTVTTSVINKSNGLQCFDAVGWAAGRASGL